MTLSPEEREQVVELLRCAADVTQDGYSLVGMFDAQRELEPSETVWHQAWDALDAARDDSGDKAASLTPFDEGYRACLIEAALRVEEGSWP